MLAEPFALERAEAERLADGLLATGGPGAGLSVHVAIGHDDAALLGLQVVADVFLDAFGNTPALLRREYADLLPAMTHVVVLDRTTRTAVGALILQQGTAALLKTVVDLAGLPWSIPADDALADLPLVPGDRSAADLLLLAVRPEARNSGVALVLLYASWVASAARGIDRWTAILDDSLLGGLNALTGGALRPIGRATSRPYLGSPSSTPVTARMRPVGGPRTAPAEAAGRDGDRRPHDLRRVPGGGASRVPVLGLTVARTGSTVTSPGGAGRGRGRT